MLDLTQIDVRGPAGSAAAVVPLSTQDCNLHLGSMLVMEVGVFAKHLYARVLRVKASNAGQCCS